MPLAKTDWGRFGLNGVLNYTNGKNLDTDDGLLQRHAAQRHLDLDASARWLGQRA